MNITLVQNAIVWEDKNTNLLYYKRLAESLAHKTDLIVLPEMCTTGFSMHTDALAESDEGLSMTTLGQMAEQNGMAIAGSFIGGGPSGLAYNRGFFLYPDGRKTFRNKRHLFRMGEETNHFLSGNDTATIPYLGWNMRLLICYDLRFPVWSRNVDNAYDLLLVCANWPEPRRRVWENLLVARALENQCYVCGVNRVGTDGLGLHYSGDTCLINAYGKALTNMPSHTDGVQTVTIELEPLRQFREKFPVWMDADRFELR